MRGKAELVILTWICWFLRLSGFDLSFEINSRLENNFIFILLQQSKI